MSHPNLAPRLELPCVHQGSILQWCPVCKDGANHVRECDRYERCTVGYVSDLVRACVFCPSYTPDVQLVNQSNPGVV